jgi:hypothetical protein
MMDDRGLEGGWKEIGNVCAVFCCKIIWVSITAANLVCVRELEGQVGRRK